MRSLQREVVSLAASLGKRVLCVLDDVRDPSHARVLGEPLEGATLLVTTPSHHLLPRAHHVHCGLLSKDESLMLLLRTSALPAQPSKDATDAIELCGRLPLSLALAGAMVQELGSSCAQSERAIRTDA